MDEFDVGGEVVLAAEVEQLLRFCDAADERTGDGAAHGLLEGKGKGRRHLKLHTLEDVENKHLTDYLRLAQKAAE